MSDWSANIGKFLQLQAVAFKNDLAKALYLAMLKQKDAITEKCHYDEDPFYMYETLQQALNPRKKDEPKYTYAGVKKIKDKDTGITMEEEGQLPMKKFVTITVEAKSILIYLLNAYVKEVKSYYDSHKHTFPEESKLLSELIKYSQSQSADPIIPFIFYASEVSQIDKIIKGGFNSIEKKLVDKMRTYFKDKEDKTPDAKLALVAETFVRFLNMLAVMSADILYEKRQAVNMQFLFGVLRVVSSLVQHHDASLNQDVLNNMKEYVEATKPKKKEKGEDGEDGEDEEEEEEEDDGEKKKKPAKKTTTKKPPAKKPTAKKGAASKTETAKKRGRPSKAKAQSEEPEDDEGGVDGGDIDGAIDAIEDDNDGEWQDEAGLEDD
jgi:hypothetical protein